MPSIGTAFQAAGIGNHLWVVISDPNIDGEVVCINVTDALNYPQSSCHLAVGEHPFITKPSVLMYKTKGLRLWQTDKIDGHIRSGQLNQHEDFRLEIVKRIIDGAFLSNDIPPVFLACLKPML